MGVRFGVPSFDLSVGPPPLRYENYHFCVSPLEPLEVSRLRLSQAQAGACLTCWTGCVVGGLLSRGGATFSPDVRH